MPSLGFETAQIEYAALRRCGDVALLERLAAQPAALPPGRFFHPDQADHVSHSPFLDRRAVSELLAQQNPWYAPPDPGARYVVAGQQAGLLTGPLYTFLKAVSAISVARVLARTSTTPVLPLFWIASEDHDVREVNHVTINGRTFVHPYTGEVSRGKVPQVADISIREAREPLLSFLRQTLPATEFTPWVLDMVAASDFSNYATAFRDLMRAIFASYDLRLIDPIALRALTAPVLAALAERWGEVAAALAQGAGRLRGLGLEPPLDTVRLFMISAGGRVPLEIDTQGAGDSTAAQLAAQIRLHPERFSAGAAVRPICQDAVLPVAVTLAGPTELAYLWQIEPLYALARVSPSLCMPRISATFVERTILRSAQKAGLSLATLLEAALGFDLASTSPRADAAADQDAQSDAITRQGQELLATIDRIPHAQPPRWLRTGRDAIAAGITHILKGLREERLTAVGLQRTRREKIREAIVPNGKLQERGVNVIQFLNLHGPQFVELAIARLDPFAIRHQMVAITDTPDREGDAGRSQTQ